MSPSASDHRFKNLALVYQGPDRRDRVAGKRKFLSYGRVSNCDIFSSPRSIGDQFVQMSRCTARTIVVEKIADIYSHRKRSIVSGGVNRLDTAHSIWPK